MAASSESGGTTGLERVEPRGARARLGVLLVLLCASSITWALLLPTHRERTLTVTFLDVGQGDATLIESPTGFEVLIDGGSDGGVLRGLSRELGFFDRTLDLVVATHPDRDHIGGLVDVLERYEVEAILRTENVGESGIAREFAARVAAEGSTLAYARRGMTYDLGGGALLTVLFPDRDAGGLESNTSSIVLHLTYGDVEFLLTGDSPQSIERYLVALGDDLESEVLKVGHHGSRTSTDGAFLSAVAPVYSVISAGADNRYGHPHAEVVATLAEAGAAIKNTAGGSVTFVSDGRSVFLK